MDVCVTTVADDAFLLDLLNTTPVIDGVPTDLLPDRATAAEWMSAHGLTTTTKEWSALVEARSALQAVVRGEKTAQVLQPFVAGVRLTPSVTPDGLDWTLEHTSGAARAVLAWDGLRIHSPGRLRPCANTECQLFLIDRSKPNTARWCSMSLCGNRMKVRRHYRRSRG